MYWDAQHVRLDFHYIIRLYAQAHYTQTNTSVLHEEHSVSWCFHKREPDPYLNEDVGQWKELTERMTVSDRKWGSTAQLSLTSLCRQAASPWKQKPLKIHVNTRKLCLEKWHRDGGLRDQFHYFTAFRFLNIIFIKTFLKSLLKTEMCGKQTTRKQLSPFVKVHSHWPLFD